MLSTTLPPLHGGTSAFKHKFFRPPLSMPFHPKPFSSFAFPSIPTPINNLISTTRYSSFAPITELFSNEGLPVKSRGFITKASGAATTNSAAGDDDEEFKKLRGQSSMPDRFRPLTIEAPDKPVRWPWLIAAAFGLYTWRYVLWELSNWKKIALAIVGFFGYILKYMLALVFRFIGDPITFSIRVLEDLWYTIRACYSGIIAYAPIPELTVIIILTSAVIAVAEAAVPDSARSQPWLLTLAGAIGFAAVKNYISELFFWMLLLGLFAYARLVKKRDYVSCTLPLAAVLAAVGEPWIRVVVMASFMAMAIFHRSKTPSDLQQGDEDGRAEHKVPVPLLCAALAIGTRIAAKWAGYRHLTWMIV